MGALVLDAASVGSWIRRNSALLRSLGLAAAVPAVARALQLSPAEGWSRPSLGMFELALALGALAALTAAAVPHGFALVRRGWRAPRRADSGAEEASAPARRPGSAEDASAAARQPDGAARVLRAGIGAGMVLSFLAAWWVPGAFVWRFLNGGGAGIEDFAARFPAGALLTYAAGYWAARLCADTELHALFRRYQLATRRRPAFAALLSYTVAGLAGTWLLSLPFCQRDVLQASLLSSFFISFSALTTTGLANVDIVAQWNGLGHAVILLLVVFGGLGIFVLWALISAAGRRFATRTDEAPAFGTPELVEDRELLVFFQRGVVLFVAIIGTGAALLALVDHRSVGLGERIFRAVFHAASAFCNAGFALEPTAGGFGGGWGYLEAGIMSLLVLLGGLGPAVLLFPRSRHARVATALSVLLVVVGAVLLYVLDFANPGDNPLLSLYQSVAARTAGFAWFDFGALSDGAVLWLAALMFLGACPGGTGGGAKVTVLHAMRRAFVALGRGESVDESSVRDCAIDSMEAFVVIGMLGLLALAGTLTLSLLETAPGLSLLFEVVSALSTTGLSKNLTPELSPLSLVVLVGLMVVGKVGPILLLQAYFKGKPDTDGFLERVAGGRVLSV